MKTRYLGIWSLTSRLASVPVVVLLGLQFGLLSLSRLVHGQFGQHRLPKCSRCAFRRRYQGARFALRALSGNVLMHHVGSPLSLPVMEFQAEL